MLIHNFHNSIFLTKTRVLQFYLLLKLFYITSITYNHIILRILQYNADIKCCFTSIIAIIKKKNLHGRGHLKYRKLPFDLIPSINNRSFIHKRIIRFSIHNRPLVTSGHRRPQFSFIKCHPSSNQNL